MAAFSAAEAIEMAMEIEKNGEVYYNEVVANSTDPEVKALFEDLAIQEQGHYRLFKAMLGKSESVPGLVSDEYDEYKAYLAAALDNALFAGPDKALALAQKAKDKDTALRAALGFEKDTLLFFYDLREIVAEKDRPAIAGVIQEEKKHVRRLAGML